MNEIKGHGLPTISVQLLIDKTMAPARYNTGNGQIRPRLGENNFDPSVVIHEISHQIQSSIMEKTKQDLYNEIGKNLDRKSYFEFIGAVRCLRKGIQSWQREFEQGSQLCRMLNSQIHFYRVKLFSSLYGICDVFKSPIRSAPPIESSVIPTLCLRSILLDLPWATL